MAWIESHQNLRYNPKTRKLARILNLSVPAAIGHLHCLWWWATDYAQDGDLSKYTDEDIADAIGWDDDPQQAVDALINSGFIDDDGSGTRTIHDWNDYAGRLIEQRQANRKRSQRAYNEKKRAENGGSTDSGDHSTQSLRADHAQTTDRLQEVCGATVPNQTVPNLTLRRTPRSPPQAEGDSADLQQRRFDEFWQEYPKKVGKEAARKAWDKIKPNAELRQKISAAVETATQSEQWRRENGRFIPNPATWLNQGRWDDEPAVTKPGGGTNARTGPPPGDPLEIKRQSEHLRRVARREGDP
jgi:hypothetical protein